MDFFISNAYAQTESAGGGLLGLMPLILIFVIFYFMLIRPQMKRAKQHKELVSQLAKGDEVVTNGGLLGKITKVDESFVTLKVSDGVEVRLQRHAVASVMPKGTVKSA